MRLAQIEYFLSVAEMKNITAASKSLYISQPALSKQISLLEEELGVKLFSRESRGVALTQAGEQFARDLRGIMDELEDARQRVIAKGKAEYNTINIGCFEGDSIDDFYPSFYSYLREKIPDIKPVLYREDFSASEKKLEQDKLDLILIFDVGRKIKKGYYTKPIFKRRAAIIFSPRLLSGADRPSDISDFRDKIFLTTRARNGNELLRYDIKELEGLGIYEPKIEVVENSMTLMTYLTMGYGYCIMSKEAVSLGSNLCYYIPEKEIEMNILAVWKEKHPYLGKLMGEYEAAGTEGNSSIKYAEQ